MKKTIKCYLTYSTSKYNAGFQVSDLDMASIGERVQVTTLDVDFDLPDDFDPRPHQIAALKAKQALAAADFHTLTTEIMRQINELQALEMT